MELYGNKDTFNLENVLRLNIINADYFRDTCLKCSTWEDVVDEIYYDVEHVEPWMSGNARGASTAFCLMYRLFTLKVTTRQIKDLLQHPDSVYIRAVGFLYLRYVGDPKTLWSWYEPYLTDDQEMMPSPGGPPVTVGEFIIDILLCQYYFETIFPRIPKKVMDSAVEELKRRGLRFEAKGNGGAGGADRRGVDEPNRRPASVKASLSVAFGQRAPNRSNAREDTRVRDPSLWGPDGRREGGDGRDGREGREQRNESFKRQSRSKSRSRSRSRSPDRYVRRNERHPRDRERERSERDRGRNERDWDRERERSVERRRERSRRSRSKSHSPYRRSRHHRSRRDSRERQRSRSRDRRKRSQSPGNPRGRRSHATSRDVRDVFKESAPTEAPSNANRIKMVYGS